MQGSPRRAAGPPRRTARRARPRAPSRASRARPGGPTSASSRPARTPAGTPRASPACSAARRARPPRRPTRGSCGEQRHRPPALDEPFDVVAGDLRRQRLVGLATAGARAGVLDSGARRDQHEALDAFGHRERGVQREPAAHRVAGEREPSRRGRGGEARDAVRGQRVGVAQRQGDRPRRRTRGRGPSGARCRRSRGAGRRARARSGRQRARARREDDAVTIRAT